MRCYSLKEIVKITRISMFVLVEFLNEKGFDIELEDAFLFEDVSQHYFQMILNNSVVLKQRQFLRIEEINYKLTFLNSKKNSLGEMSGSREDFEISTNFIKEELKKVKALIALINKQREQVTEYIEAPYRIKSPDINNRYYIYNSHGFVMEVGTLVEAREQASRFNGIIKDIRDNIVR